MRAQRQETHALRFDRRGDIPEALLKLGCCLIFWNTPQPGSAALFETASKWPPFAAKSTKSDSPAWAGEQ
jgi:hypothetical protein